MPNHTETSGKLHIPYLNGDITLSWDPNNDAEVVDAETAFNDLIAKGYTAYTVGRRKRPSDFAPGAGKLRFLKGSVTQVTKFDKDQTNLVMSPPARLGNSRQQGVAP